jgi:hypothetical protein
VSDVLQLYKPSYKVTILFVSGGNYQASWIEFVSDLAVERTSWGAIKSLYR